jgi:hypothetical protein
MGDAMRVDADSALVSLNRSPELAERFARVAAAFAANRRPIIRSTEAFQIADPDLLPEALTYDSVTGAFVVGSLAKHKVVRVALSTCVVSVSAGGGIVGRVWLDAATMTLGGCGGHVQIARRKPWWKIW